MTQDNQQDTEDHSPEPERLTLLQLIGSALAAGIGVQSSKNRARDFSKGRPLQFIVIGVAFTVLFVVVVAAVVNLVLYSVG